jgi:glutaminyl-tRNA synthetase
LVEPILAVAKPMDKFQFMRHGYFCADHDSTPEKPVFNLTVSLKDSWGKQKR